MLFLAWAGLVAISILVALISSLIVGCMVADSASDPDTHAMLAVLGPIALVTGFLIYRCTIGS